MKTNKKTPAQPVFTHNGGKASRTNIEGQLRRSVLACMLWEDSFYESGKDIAARISELVAKCNPRVVSELAIEAREKFKLRHVPLLLVREMVRYANMRPFVSYTLENVIQRPDELCEFLALYWKDQVGAPIANSVRKGLAKAFVKFNGYQLAKYNSDKDIKLRDVMFMVHPKPTSKEQEEVFKKLANNTLESPDTWEVELSAGKDKKQVFSRLMQEKKLGGLALLRNLRNMVESGVDDNLIRESVRKMQVERILPFRFITAAKYAPRFEPVLEEAMLKCLGGKDKLPGETVLLIDVSGSMNAPIGGKSELNRRDASCALSILARETCENIRVFTFSNRLVEVAPRRGFALRDAINTSQHFGATYLKKAIEEINGMVKYDRMIVFTDEQSNDGIAKAINKKSYVINVAAYKNGVGYDDWNKIDGFSEAVLDYIYQSELED